MLNFLLFSFSVCVFLSGETRLRGLTRFSPVKVTSSHVFWSRYHSQNVSDSEGIHLQMQKQC